VHIDQVIGPGDRLLGSTLGSVSNGPAINANGQIAFSAALANGARVLIRADPK
jgi:hypothetical protein